MDDDIRRDIAFALAKHIRANRPADADEARMIAAADVLRSPDFRTSCLRDKATSAHAKTTTYDWYGEPHPAHNTGANQTCELDHLVSLELGGADTLDNNWPQCGPPDAVLRARFFKQNDAVENYLAARVRDGAMDLNEAERGIAQDWMQYLNAACEVQRCE